MNSYQIILKNKASNQVKTKTVNKLCFAEAAQEAYLARNKLGYSWKITSINQEGEIKDAEINRLGSQNNSTTN